MKASVAPGLKKGISLPGIVSIGVGSAVGVSIFSILAPTVALAGPGILAAMTAAMAPMVIFAILYAFMGSAAPTSGASFEWPTRFIHPFVGFFISWLRIMGSVSALIVLAMVLVSYLQMAFPLPLKATMFAIFLITLLGNLIGVSIAARAQSIMLVILIATCAILVAASARQIQPANFVPFLPEGWGGVFAAVPLMISLFLGIESATEVGEEIQDPGRNIPKGIAISVLLTAVIYMSTAVAALGVLGVDSLASSKAPLLDTAVAVLGDLGKPLILVSATVAIGTSINGAFMILSRFLFAMGRRGMLPAALANIHRRLHTPHIAITAAFSLCCLGLFLPSSLIFLFLAVNIPTLLKYAAISFSAGRLVDQAPELYEKAAFRPSRRTVRRLANIGVGAALTIIVLGISADWRPYALLASWAGLGVIYYLIWVRPRMASPADRIGSGA